MKEFVALRAKTYSYLKGNNDKDKQANDTTKCIIKKKFKFEDYQKCFKEAQFEYKHK